jgi:sec-independent protein translocase protein TatB
MLGVSFNELLIILAVALLVLGPDRLPEIARSLGKALGQIKRATDDITGSLMADTGLKETADSLKKTVMDSGLKDVTQGLKEGLNIKPGITQEHLKKIFDDIQEAPRQAVQALADVGSAAQAAVGSAAQAAVAPAAAGASQDSAAAEGTTAPGDAPKSESAAPATPAKKPAARFADDDSE